MFGLVKKKSENFKVFTLSSDYKIREKCAALKKKKGIQQNINVFRHLYNNSQPLCHEMFPDLIVLLSNEHCHNHESVFALFH